MDRRKKRRLLRGLGYFGLGLTGAFALFWWWQPWDFDLVPRTPDRPLPLVDPDSGRLFSKGTKVMVVTGHPDDESFYVGGTLTKLLESGADLAFVLCTDGDKAYYGPLTNVEENRTIRREETQDVARKLGTADVTFLGYPDGRLMDTEELEGKIAKEIERFNPEYILTFDDLYPRRFSHSDHRRAGEATVKAARQAGFKGWLLLFQSNAPTFRVDVTPYWEAKRRLLATHKSQFYGERLTRIENMVRSTAAVEGRILGVALAEGFRATRI